MSAKRRPADRRKSLSANAQIFGADVALVG
jgi:hypothetical protein